jgi:predicted nucleic acid-binding protein
MPRIFVDSSTIIALAQIGELDLLKDSFEQVFITETIEKELVMFEFPENSAIKAALGQWITVVQTNGKTDVYENFGIDRGEATLFLLPAEDVLILDDLNARRLAQVRMRKYFGLLGALVASAQAKKITRQRGLEVLDKLAEGNFRMTVTLYKEIYKKLNEI